MAHRFTRTCLVEGERYEAGRLVPETMAESTVDYLVATGRAEDVADGPPADEPAAIDEPPKEDSPDTAEEPAASAAEPPTGDEPAADASTPLEEVPGLQPDHLEKLAAAGVTTLGEYDTYVSTQPLTTINGIGKATSAAIVDAVDAHRDVDDDGSDA